MIKKHAATILILILSFAFLTRVYRLHVPDKYVFDEVYHVVTAKLVAKNDPRAFEWWHGAIEPNTAIDWLHPPLAKYTQAFFINIFGAKNSFSWRISSVLFGVGVIWATYRLSQKLFKDEFISLLAAGIASLDGLLLVQSRITMNDIHVTFFILLTLIYYLDYRENCGNKGIFRTGLLAGLAMGSKWSGLFVLLIMWLFEGLKTLKELISKKINWEQTIQRILLLVVALGLLPFTIYIASYSQMFLQGKGWTHFVDLHKQIWWYQTNLTATHTYQSQPWQWFLNLRPVWFYVDYPDQTHIANIYAIGNPALHLVGIILVFGSVITLIWDKIKNLTAHQTLKIESLSPLNWLVTTYFLLWIPWQISPRIMFYYHYTPAVPLLSIIIAFWLAKINKYSRVIILAFIFITFVIWYPQWTAIPMPKTFVESVYYLVPSWK